MKKRKIKRKSKRWTIEGIEHKYLSYHSSRKNRHFHYKIFSSLLVAVLLILAFALDYPYSIAALVLAIVVSLSVIYWILKVWWESNKHHRKKKKYKHKILLLRKVHHNKAISNRRR